jgi:hypothetical protein
MTRQQTLSLIGTALSIIAAGMCLLGLLVAVVGAI